MSLATFKDEVLNKIEELEFDIESMRDEGETDLRSVISRIRNLYQSVVRLEDQGDYLNG